MLTVNNYIPLCHKTLSSVYPDITCRQYIIISFPFFITISAQEADSNANQVAENALGFECNHAISSVASLSALTWALCLLMVYLSLN